MKFLLLNTCASEATVALADTERQDPIVILSRMPSRSASERLVAIVRESIAEAAWRPTDLSAIGVVTGPGSFTGVRVGLSVAKGLSEANGVPLLAVSALSMLAALGMREGRVCALLDAGRNEFYCGEYVDGDELGESLLSKSAAAVVASRAGVVAVCDAATFQAFSDDLKQIRMIPEPTAAEALPFVMKRFQKGDFDDSATLDANYLRRSDSEIFAKPAMPRSG